MPRRISLLHRFGLFCCLFSALVLAYPAAKALAAHQPNETANPASAAAADQPMSTPEHLRAESWWPTRLAASRADYAGTAKCAECHASIAKQQVTTEMARTLVPASRSAVLANSMQDTLQLGEFHYALQHTGADFSMLVTGDGEQRRAVLDWAFGSGTMAQSYLWSAADGTYRESRFNIFAETHAMGATPGRLRGDPTTIKMAVGRTVEPFEARTCFARHTTALYSATDFNASTVVPGIGCESCHGPGAEHGRIMEQARSSGADSARLDRHILNPADLSPVKAVDFCGSCHGTTIDMELAGTHGREAVRFPALRLQQSKCWGVSGDTRLECFGCHDPHQPLERISAAYDPACLSCHVTRGMAADGAHPGKACPVANANCAQCHMPKVEVPEMHHRFTDHKIRVVRNGDALADLEAQ